MISGVINIFVERRKLIILKFYIIFTLGIVKISDSDSLSLSGDDLILRKCCKFLDFENRHSDCTILLNLVFMTYIAFIIDEQGRNSATMNRRKMPNFI